MRAAPIIFLLASILLVPSAWALEAPLPSFTLGDHWDEARQVPDGNGGFVPATLNSTIAAFEPIVVDGQSVPAIRMHLVIELTGNLGGAPFVSRSEGDIWTRASDGAKLKEVTRATQTLGGTLRSDVTETTIYAPPCLERMFPLRVGDVHEFSCPEQTSDTDGANETKTTTGTERVLREETITTALGTFDTLVLERTTLGDKPQTKLIYYAPEVCAPVKETSVTDKGTETTELTAFRCGAAHGGPEEVDVPPTVTTPASTPPPASTTPPVTTSPVATPPTDATPTSITATTIPVTSAPTDATVVGLPGPGTLAILVAVGAALLVARRAP